jgi:hypothetical protein
MQRLSIAFSLLVVACAKEPLDHQCFYEQEELDEPPLDPSDQYVVCMPRKVGVGCSPCDGNHCYDGLREANPGDAKLADSERPDVAICGPEPIGDDDRCCYQVSFYDGE